MPVYKAKPIDKIIPRFISEKFGPTSVHVPCLVVCCIHSGRQDFVTAPNCSTKFPVVATKVFILSLQLMVMMFAGIMFG